MTPQAIAIRVKVMLVPRSQQMKRPARVAGT
jgi:hypothetical protein